MSNQAKVDEITNIFKGATLNYAQHCLLKRDDTVAIYEVNELGLQQVVSWKNLYDHVSQWQQFFKEQGT